MNLDPTLIIGTGLIGASIGRRLTQMGVEVFLADKDHAHAVVAASRGAGLVAMPRPQVVALVVVATPPSAVAETVAQALHRFPNATVTDVASVKAKIEQDVRAITAGDGRSGEMTRYVGSHPMAGSQHAGPLMATPDLFVDRPWVLVQRADQDAGARATVAQLITACGARLITLDAATHDNAVATISHLPQLMSSLTAARLRDASAIDLSLAGQGLRDVTRIAASDVVLWCQIVAANTSALRVQLEAVRDDLDNLIDHLDDSGAVASLLKQGNEGVAALPGKHGRAAAELVSVVVRIPDTPGALARLFADIERAGANVEDLSIEHDLVREVGYLSVQVTPEKAQPLAESLRMADWQVR